MNLKALRDRAAAIRQEMEAIGTLVTKETRSMHDDERKRFDALKAEAAQVRELIEQAELAADDLRRTPSASDADAAAATASRVAAGLPAVTVGRLRAEDDPKRGYRTSAEFFADVMAHARTGRMSERLRPLAAQGADEQGTHSDAHGGFLQPTAFNPGLLMVRPDADPTIGRTMPIPMNAPTIELAARTDKNHSTSVSGGFTVSRRPETVSGTSSRSQVEKIRLSAMELFGLCYVSETLITDSPASAMALVEAGYRDEFPAKMFREKLTGTGAGEFLGVLNSPCLITVTKESGQSDDTIVKENIDKMRMRCWGYGQAIWLAIHDALPQLKSLTQTIGTGGAPVPYYTQDQNGQAYLDGRPLFFTEEASALGDAGDLILGNWSQYLEGTYEGLQQAESIHVRFDARERTFRFYLRNDGQPWWRSVLTPRNGSTLSPFVTLGAR